MIRRGLALVATVAMLLGTGAARADDSIGVVASFSILGDFVRAVGGARVAVTTLVGANGDIHVYTPSPADVATVARAKLLVINGLGLEGWLPRLVQSSGGRARVVVASAGVTPRMVGGAADPHAWQSVANAKIYVGNIRDALIAADPAGAAIYRANAERYLTRLDALDAEVREAVAHIPPERRRIVATHDAFHYFSDAYGIAFIAPQGLSTDSEPSARDIAATITQIRTAKIPAVFLENMNDPRLIRRIAAETGVEVGGKLYSDSLTGEKGDAPTYIDMVRHNIKALTSALTDHGGGHPAAGALPSAPEL